MENVREISNKDFEAYIERIKKIAELSSPLIDDMQSPDEYLKTLSGNFREIGDLAKDNRQMISDVLDPILRSDEPLTEKTVKQLDEFYLELSGETELKIVDFNYSFLLSERLFSDSKNNDDINKRISCLDKLLTSYAAMYAYTVEIVSAPEIHKEIRDKIINIYKNLMYYIDKSRFKELDPESRKLVMIDSRYGLTDIMASYFPISEETRQFWYDGLMRSLSYASDPFYIEALPDYDWKLHVYRVYEYLILNILIENNAGFTYCELQKISENNEKIKQLIDSDPDYYNNSNNYFFITNIYYYMEALNYLTGKVSKKEYKQYLYSNYLSRNSTNFDRDGITENFFAVQDYMILIDKNNISEREKTILLQMYHSVTDYCFRAPSVDIDFNYITSIQGIVSHFIEFSGGITIEEFVLNLFAALHPPTYIHSHMVAKITRCLTHHLIKTCPELFIGVCGCPAKEQVYEYAEKIENYAYHSALCHDFGKIYILNVISTYGRKILDNEFELIKQHPAMGAILLAKHESTKGYADVAKGHHLWYNGERGYPTDFDAKSSTVKTIIDIVACADCMDAATDKVGRSYNSGKTLDEYIEEVREGSGTHYAPYLYELMKREDVYDDVAYLLDGGRKNTYRETYLLLKSVREKAKVGDQ